MMPEPPALLRRPRMVFGSQARERICAQLTQGLSLSFICRQDDMPKRKTVEGWLKKEPAFARAVAEARAAGGGVKRGGRPTLYSETLALAFCEKVGEGHAVHLICQQAGMPAQGTLHLWLRRYPEFVEMLAVARMIQEQRLFDEVREIADGATPATVQVARTRIAARQWQAAKLAPRKAAEAEDRGAGPIIVEIVSCADLKKPDLGAGDAAGAAAP